MKIAIDWDLCQGHGVCEMEAPEVFGIDADGNMFVRDPSPPGSLREAVETAAQYCPQQAIRIEDP
jgi:ferredoxin